MLVKNEKVNKAFLKVIEILMDADPEADSEMGRALKFLAKAVEEFEDFVY